MKKEVFLNKWYDKNIDNWGGETSPEYINFQREYRNLLKTMRKEIGLELYSFHKNHYNFCAVLKSNKSNQLYYISISDVRYLKNEWAKNILYRTMEHDKDWTGGTNRYSSLENLSQQLLELDNQIYKNLSKKINSQMVSQDETEKSITDDFDNNYDY